MKPIPLSKETAKRAAIRRKRREAVQATFVGKRSELEKELFDLVIKNVAAYDAVLRVNNRLQSMGLNQIIVDGKAAKSLIIGIFQMSCAQLFLDKSSLRQEIRDDFLQKQLQAQFPTQRSEDFAKQLTGVMRKELAKDGSMTGAFSSQKSAPSTKTKGEK